VKSQLYPLKIINRRHKVGPPPTNALIVAPTTHPLNAKVYSETINVLRTTLARRKKKKKNRLTLKLEAFVREAEVTYSQ
jgi:hypothetical protein